MSEAPLKELIGALSSLFKDDTYSDMCLMSGGITYKLHKAIVCSRSQFFARAFDKTSNFKEAQTGVLELPEDDPQAVKLMIHYFYHLDYPHVSLYSLNSDTSTLPPKQQHADETLRNIDPDTAGPSTEPSESIQSPQSPNEPWEESEPMPEPIPEPEPETVIKDDADYWSTFDRRKTSKRNKSLSKDVISEPNLILHAHVYALAEKFRVDGLKALALEKFSRDATEHWNSPDFLQAAKIVYTSTVTEDRDMRDIVVETLHRHKSLLGAQMVRNYLRDLEELSYDLLLYVWRNGPHWK